MTDPNSTRSHYRRTSENLARRRRLNAALRWLALWLIIAVIGLASIL